MDAKEILKDFKPYHSRFQIERFILGSKHCTPWGLYKQTLRELQARHESLESAKIARELALIDIEELSATIAANDYDMRRNKLRVKAKRDALIAMDRNTDDVRREYTVILHRAEQLKEDLGKITDERRDQLEAEFWYEKFRREAMLDLALTGRFGRSTFESILSLPREDRSRLAESLRKTPKALEWLESGDKTLLEACCDGKRTKV